MGAAECSGQDPGLAIWQAGFDSWGMPVNQVVIIVMQDVKHKFWSLVLKVKST